MDSFGMDNFCSYHLQNNSKKTCPQWVKSMTLVINYLLYQQILIEKQPNESKNEEIIEEAPLEYVMFLWDRCIDSDDENIEEVFIGDTLVAKDSLETITYSTKVLYKALPLLRRPMQAQEN
jgi:hypothetical protein